MSAEEATATVVADAIPADAAAAAAPDSDDNLFKVFVGNLAFTTTEDDIKEAFSKAGSVAGVNIVSRHNRSLGYGFVTFAAEDEAIKAVELFDKTELASRQLNVERIKPRAPGDRPSRPRSRNQRRKPSATEGDAAEASAAAEKTGEEKEKRRQRRPRRPRSAPGEATAARIDDAEPTAPAAAGEEGAKPRKRAVRKKAAQNHSGPSGEAGEATDAAEKPAGDKPARQRRPRRRASQPNMSAAANDPSQLSKTILFVANLPFKVDNDRLAEIFKDYSVTSAKVVTLRNGRSKGFGFVEVANEDEQQRVLSDLKNIEVDGRELIIKVAHASSELHREADAADADTKADGEKDVAAAAPAATA